MAESNDARWTADDPAGPFGDETGREVLEAFRDARAAKRRIDPIALLTELLEEWEVEDTGWDVIEEHEVEALGAEDELGLLLRDEAVIALAFAQLTVDGRVDGEVRRRALLALGRQALPALLHGWGDRASLRRRAVERMREALLGPAATSSSAVH